jgi:hypothetical protein
MLIKITPLKHNAEIVRKIIHLTLMCCFPHPQINTHTNSSTDTSLKHLSRDLRGICVAYKNEIDLT